MAKTNDERIQEALGAIEDNAGREARRWVEERLPTDAAQLAALSFDLKLGSGSVFQSSSETSRRRLVRGVMLAYMSTDMSMFNKAMVRNAIKNEPLGDLQGRLRKFLPSTQISGKFDARAYYPGSFTNPSVHNAGRAFRYIITGVVKAPQKIAARGYLRTQAEADEYAKYLDRFPGTVLLSETRDGGTAKQVETLKILPAKRYLGQPNLLRLDVISTTLIDQDHVSTYFPWGFILSVPPENIVSASSRDQAVANRPQNVITEMERVNREKGLSTPDAILAETTGRNGHTGYNEVVVIGKSPEGTEVDVTGIFVKVSPAGNLYIRPDETVPYVNDLIADIQRCSLANHIPVVKIRDSTSEPSTTAWPF